MSPFVMTGTPDVPLPLNRDLTTLAFSSQLFPEQAHGKGRMDGPLGSIPSTGGRGVVSRHTAPEPKKFTPPPTGSFPPGIPYPVPHTLYLTTRPLGFASSHRGGNLHARIVLCSQKGAVMETPCRRNGAACEPPRLRLAQHATVHPDAVKYMVHHLCPVSRV